MPNVDNMLSLPSCLSTRLVVGVGCARGGDGGVGCLDGVVGVGGVVRGRRPRHALNCLFYLLIHSFYYYGWLFTIQASVFSLDNLINIIFRYSITFTNILGFVCYVIYR
jgi:hypothetical protein